MKDRPRRHRRLAPADTALPAAVAKPPADTTRAAWTTDPRPASATTRGSPGTQPRPGTTTAAPRRSPDSLGQPPAPAEYYLTKKDNPFLGNSRSGLYATCRPTRRSTSRVVEPEPATRVRVQHRTQVPVGQVALVGAADRRVRERCQGAGRPGAGDGRGGRAAGADRGRAGAVRCRRGMQIIGTSLGVLLQLGSVTALIS